MDEELKALLALDGASFEFGDGYVAEFEAKATGKTKQRPHGVSYALVFRPKGEEPWVRFDNAHAVRRPGGPYVKRAKAHDHWCIEAKSDPGRPLRIHHADEAPRGLLARS